MRRGNLLILVLVLMAVVVGVLMLNDGSRILGLDENAFAHLARASIWMTVIGAGMVMVFRGNLAGALKQAVIWVLGFVVMIGLYSYRAEFREVGKLIVEVLDGLKAANSDEGNAAVEARVKEKVLAMTARFPIYAGLG